MRPQEAGETGWFHPADIKRRDYRRKPPLLNPEERGDMSQLINAKGLGSALPVILARDALELYDEITMVADGREVVENLQLLGLHAGYSGLRVAYLTDVTGEPGDVCWIRLRKTRPGGKKPGTDRTGRLTTKGE
jgi:hypothetical protein